MAFPCRKNHHIKRRVVSTSEINQVESEKFDLIWKLEVWDVTKESQSDRREGSKTDDSPTKV